MTELLTRRDTEPEIPDRIEELLGAERKLRDEIRAARERFRDSLSKLDDQDLFDIVISMSSEKFSDLPEDEQAALHRVLNSGDIARIIAKRNFETDDERETAGSLLQGVFAELSTGSFDSDEPIVASELIGDLRENVTWNQKLRPYREH